MKQMFVAAVALVFSAGAALACTQEEAMAKAQDLMAKLQALAQKDPQKAEELNKKMMASPDQPKDLDEACKMYDRWIAEAKS